MRFTSAVSRSSLSESGGTRLDFRGPLAFLVLPTGRFKKAYGTQKSAFRSSFKSESGGARSASGSSFKQRAANQLHKTPLLRNYSQNLTTVNCKGSLKELS